MIYVIQLLYLLLMFVVYVGLGTYALLVESIFLLALALIGGALVGVRLNLLGK